MRITIIVTIILVAIAFCTLSATTGTAVWNSHDPRLPFFARWDGTQFINQDSTVDIGEWRIIAGAEALIRDEIILVGVDQDKEIDGLMRDSTGWSALPFNPFNTVKESNWWGFDVAYELSSGRAILVWNNGTEATDGLSYRIWNGSTWSQDSTITTPLIGEPMHMHLAANPVCNEMVLIVSNSNSQDYAIVWDGSTWGNDQVLDNGNGDDRTDIYVAYEQQSGYAMVIYGKGTETAYYRNWNGAIWSAEDSLVKPPDAGGTIRWTILSADPGSDQIALGILTKDKDFWMSVWDGNSWESPQTATNSATDDTYPAVAVAFEGQSGKALATYGEEKSILYRIWSSDSGWSTQDTAVNIDENTNSIMLYAATKSNEIMLSVQDDTKSLNYLLWDGEIWGAPNELETNTDENKNQPFIFLWDVSNSPPVLDSIGSKNVEEGQNLNIDVSATDPNGTTPNLTAENLPTNANFLDNEDGTGTFDFNPNYTQEGIYYVTFIATDGDLADSAVMAITVTPAPITYIDVTPANTTIEELASFQFSALGFDAGSSPVRDLTDSVVWSTTDPTGLINAGGLYTAGNVLSPPEYYVKAVYQGALSDSGSVSVISTGVLNYIEIEWEDSTAIGDTTLNTDNDTTVIYCRAYASDSSLLGNVAVTWSLIGADSIGTVDPGPDANTILELYAIGTGNLVALHESGLADTSGIITSKGGSPVQVVVSPDTVTISADSTLQFNAESLDADGNPSEPSIVVNWSVLGGIGPISLTGLFTAGTAGAGYIVVEGGGLTDTTGIITVIPGEPLNITVVPDSASVNIGDSIQFSAVGYDADSNVADLGEITWKTLGRVGNINDSGLFIATAPGLGKVSAASSVKSLSDTSSFIDVQELYLSTIPIGNPAVRPGQTDAAILAFRIHNYYEETKSLNSVTLRDGSTGTGNLSQRLSNVDSVALYLDIDNDSTLTGADSLIFKSGYDSVVTVAIDPISIAATTGKQFIATVDIAMYPRDGDTLDLFLKPSTDLGTVGGVPVTGPDTADSYGQNSIDGLVAGQVTLESTGIAEISPADTIYHVMAVDIPRNGYTSDNLNSFSLYNDGTASASDFDSLLLFVDKSNLTWNGSDQETYVGRLVFTGDRWTLSGISVLLSDASTRFHVGAFLASYPDNNATISFGVPVNGLQVASGNDGPIDTEVPPVDNIVIHTDEMLAVATVPITSRQLIPGSPTGPLLGMRLTNSYQDAVTIDSISCRLLAIDLLGATQAQLDSQIDSISLYLNLDGDINTTSGTDQLLVTSTLTDGVVVFQLESFDIEGSGGTLQFTVDAYLNLFNARNNNTLKIKITEAEDFFFTPSVTVNGSFPLENNSSFPINIFPSAAVIIDTVSSQTIFGGQVNQQVMDFTLPSNGYASDVLQSISVMNAGSLKDLTAISQVQLWVDADGSMIEEEGTLAGRFTWEKDRWILGELAVPIPEGGQRFFITVNISKEQFDAGTLDLQIPTGGVVYSSGVTGPDDSIVGNGETHFVFPPDRVTVISITGGSQSITPGSVENPLLTFALYNGYVGRVQNLNAVTFTNISRSQGDDDYADYQLGQVSLYYDADKNRTFDNDSLLAAGSFSNSKLFLAGMDIALAPESLAYFFVTADLPLEMIDSDSLALSINEPSDFGFGSDVNVNGDLPTTMGGYLIVNGSVAEQYHLRSLQARTLSPDDTSVMVLAFHPPMNGALSDTITSLTISNRLSADDSDIETMELWLDLNGDSTWQSTDSLVDTFTYAGSEWSTGSIQIVADSNNPFLFVTVDVSASATPDVGLQAEIPINGCQYMSANDGPIDQSLLASAKFTISNSGLRLTHTPLNETYTIGQPIDVNITATNLLGITMDGVIGEVITITDSQLIAFDSSQSGPVSLDPGNSSDFSFYYTASSVGSVAWELRSTATSPFDTSANILTDTINIQTPPSHVGVQMINSIPTAVTRGQEHVFPFNLRIAHGDSLASYASLRLDSLLIRVESSSGTGLLADDVFSRIVLATGYANLAIIDTVAADSLITLTLSEPVFIEPGQQQQLSLLVDIDINAGADDFTLSIENANAIGVFDKNTLTPVDIDQSVTFPLKTASCRIDDPSQQIAVSYVSSLSSVVNVGQENVDVLLLKLRHPGVTGTSQIQLTSLRVKFADSTGNPIITSSLAERIRLLRSQTAIADMSVIDILTDSVNIPLSAPLTLSPGESDSINVQISIQDDALMDGFSVYISDSTAFTVRDLSSGSVVIAATDTLILSAGSVFPIASGWSELKQPATSGEICLASGIPASIVGGADSVALLDFYLFYPASDDHSPILLKQVLLSVIDSAGGPLDPIHLFDRIGYQFADSAVEYQSFIPLQSGAAVFNFNNSGISLNPGDSVNFSLVADIESDTYYDHFLLSITSDDAILLSDATDTTQQPGFTSMPPCNLDFPFSTGLVKVFLPAGRPSLTVQPHAVQMAYPGQVDLTVFEGTLSYTSTTPQGNLALRGLTGTVYNRTHSGLVSIAASQIFDNVQLLIDDSTCSVDSLFSGDSILLNLASDYIFATGSELDLRLKCNLRPNASFGNYTIQFGDSTFLTIADYNLATDVYSTVTGGSYPLFSAEISLMAASLENSFTNYPNPFVASRGEETTIGYVLPEDARVDIEIFSITGEAVKRVISDEFRAAGSHQEDTWAGINDLNISVVPGTYFCRITAHYLSGKTESFKRKIAVLR